MVVPNDETVLLRTWRLSAPDRDGHGRIGNMVCTTAKGHREFGLGELSGVVLDVNIDYDPCHGSLSSQRRCFAVDLAIDAVQGRVLLVSVNRAGLQMTVGLIFEIFRVLKVLDLWWEYGTVALEHFILPNKKPVDSVTKLSR